MKTKTADRVALRWASFQTESKKQDHERGKTLYEIKVHLGDLSKHTADLDAEAQYYTEESLNDGNIQEAFEELFFTDRIKKQIDSGIHDALRRLPSPEFELTAWLEDVEGAPKKLSELKNVTLTFVIGIAYEPFYTMESEVEKSLTQQLKSIFR